MSTTVRRIATLAAVALAMAMLPLVHADAKAPAPTAISTHVSGKFEVGDYQYTGTSPDEQVTVTYATGRQNAPWVVLIHGGSWINGDRTSVQDAATLFSARGWQVFDIDYSRGTDVAYSTQVVDLLAAKSWILANAAAFHIDPSRGSVYGFSAGGQLAAVLGLSGGFRVVVSLSGVLQPQRVADDADGKRPTTEPATVPMGNLYTREQAMMGCPMSYDLTTACGQAWAAFEPQTAIKRGGPAFFIADGIEDPVVPYETGAAFAYWARQAGDLVTQMDVAGYGHDDKEILGSATRTEDMLKFVASHSA